MQRKRWRLGGALSGDADSNHSNARSGSRGKSERDGCRGRAPGVSAGQAAGSGVCACSTDALAASTVLSFRTLFLACIDLHRILFSGWFFELLQ